MNPDLVGYRIDRGRLQIVRVLGVGAYATVYEGVDVSVRGFQRRFAIKCLRKASLDSRQRAFQRREIALHQLASAHRHVVTMHRMIEEGDFIFVILDLCDHGDLFTMITDRHRVGRLRILDVERRIDL
jgi:serine/threonine protein kinase